MTRTARQLVDAYQRGATAAERRARGLHQTPPDLARALVAVGVDALGRTPRRVLDPACGGGALLLAAADELVARGVPPAEVVAGRLVGAELDPAAAPVVRAAVVEWAAVHGVAAAEVDVPVLVGDALLRPPGEWGALLPGGADLVVGNPPFLSPLSRDVAPGAAERAALRARFGRGAATTDRAAQFLLLGLDLAADDGVVVMLQPRSVLAAHGAAPVRAAAGAAGALVALWSDDGRHFDAEVAVCAPVVRRGAAPGPVRVLRGLPAADAGTAPAPVAPDRPGGRSWGPVLAGVYGVPSVLLPAGPPLAVLASATSGFRDEFYGICGALVDDPDPGPSVPPLATVGLVGAGVIEWGRRPVRVGGRRVAHPGVDLDALAVSAPKVARWVAARSVPKVLVATQTRAVEAVADPDGRVVPMTPLLSVEPHDPADLWRVLAVLLAPPVAAAAVAEGLGSGRSPGTLRWSARAALEVPLPADGAAWREGAELARAVHVADDGTRPVLLGRLGVAMCAAYGVPAAGGLLDWWLPRVGAAAPARG